MYVSVVHFNKQYLPINSSATCSIRVRNNSQPSANLLLVYTELQVAIANICLVTWCTGHRWWHYTGIKEGKIDLCI